MDLITDLQNKVHITGEKRVDQRLILALGLFGILVPFLAGWLFISDWRSSQSWATAREEGQQAVEQLLQPVTSLKSVLRDEQVQALAGRAIEAPDSINNLFSYLNGRISQISSAEVFGPNISDLRPSDLGPAGFAKLDMILSAWDGNQSLLQIHNTLQPPQMVDAVSIRSGDDLLGVLVVSMDPEFILADFRPGFDELGFIRVSQFNGRQPSSNLKQFGDASLLGEVPERIVVPGSLFRIEFPSNESIGLIGTSSLVLMILAGIFCLVASFVLNRSNQKWSLAQKVEAATKERAAAERISDERLAASPIDDEMALVDGQKPVEAVAGRKQVDTEIAEQESPLMNLHYDIAERRRLREAAHSPVELTPEIFRAYDIRGVIDKTLDSGVAKNVGQAIGTLALEAAAGPVVVARDGRLSGPYLMKGMIDGILSTGCDVLDIGGVPTGVLYFAAHEIAAGSGVMITGSHNPPDYNGFKIMIAGDTLYGDQISGLYHRIVAGEVKSGEGQATRKNVVPDYIQRIASDIQIEKPLRIVIDCGNGIGGVCAADTLRAVGAEVLPLFDEVDGTFPNHHPDPSEPENLKDLIESVRLMDADLGFAFDGDADRLGVVTLAGNIIYPDRVMMLLAMDVLDRVPGATILYDVKCTGHLPKVIKEAGGNPIMYKTGHSLMKAKMKEVGSPFAGEMSGHFFFGERWYGVDDGIYAAARLLEILAGLDTPPEAILNALPTSYSTPELKVQMQEGENHAFIESFKTAAQFDGAQISTIDGLRADFEDGWGLVRASNTTPILVVRFDAETEEALSRIKETFRSQMLELKPDLELPF